MLGARLLLQACCEAGAVGKERVHRAGRIDVWRVEEGEALFARQTPFDGATDAASGENAPRALGIGLPLLRGGSGGEPRGLLSLHRMLRLWVGGKFGPGRSGCSMEM